MLTPVNDFDFDWRGRTVLRKLREGSTFAQAANAAGLSREAVWLRRRRDPAFAHAVAEAREVGRERRVYLVWLRHPFRGLRPPTGKGLGGKPRFAYGRR